MWTTYNFKKNNQLSDQEINFCINRYKETKDDESFLKILNSVDWLIKKIATQQLKKYRISLDEETLEETYNNWVIWVILSIDKFDVNKKVKFSTFCYFKVRDEIQKWIAKSLNMWTTFLDKRIKGIWERIESWEEVGQNEISLQAIESTSYEPSVDQEYMKEVNLMNKIDELEKEFREMSLDEKELLTRVYEWYKITRKDKSILEKMIKDFKLEF